MSRRVIHAKLGLLSRLRVGTKLMVLVLLPVCSLVVVAVVAGLAIRRDANTLSRFREDARLASAVATVADDLARERIATALKLLDGHAASAALAQRQEITAAAFQSSVQMARRASAPFDVAGQLDAARRRRDALIASSSTLTPNRIAVSYGAIVSDLLGAVRRLDTTRRTSAADRVADAYIAMLQADEAAARERYDIAFQLASHGFRARPFASRWEPLEAVELGVFKQDAAGSLVAQLDRVLSSPAGRRVQQLRAQLVSAPAAAGRSISLPQWIAVSGNRITAFRALAATTAKELDRTVSHELSVAREDALRELVLSIAVVLIVAALALALRRSITWPLEDISEGARRLRQGDLGFEVAYNGRDELGDVARAFRDLHVTAGKLADEIRAKSAAIRENRLDHRADVSQFAGAWAQLLAGMNDTMDAYTELQSRQRRAEHQSQEIFERSTDLLCVVGPDGHFKRLNPAFERTLGYPSEVLLSRPVLDFIHPDDRERTLEKIEAAARGESHGLYEDRCICADGSVRWLQWAPPGPPTETGEVFGFARDVTELKRAADEQAALHRVATLVAGGAKPIAVFNAICAEVSGVLRADATELTRLDEGNAGTVIGTYGEHMIAAPGARRVFGPDSLSASVRRSGRAMRVDADATSSPEVRRQLHELGISVEVGAPIVVEGQAWGMIGVAWLDRVNVPDDAAEHVGRFTELLGMAIANAEGRAELAASRARVVEAADNARRRIERDLHDGIQQRLVAIALQLHIADDMTGGEVAELRYQLARVTETLGDAIEEVRELSRGIHPAILAHGGLEPAVRTLARHCPIPVELDLPGGVRFSERVEVAAYFTISEALTNAVKHSEASSVSISAAKRDGSLELRIRDDGVGGARVGGGSGLIGLIDRIESLGGRMRLDSPKGEGTTLLASLPLEGLEYDEALGRSARPDRQTPVI